MKKYLLLIVLLILGAEAHSMNIATYNLRNANSGDSINGNGWGQRYPHIVELIKFHGFDIFGTQEGKYHQLQDLKKALPGYDYIGVGRDDGKTEGEHSAIFYDTDKFALIDNGDFWLSTDTGRPNLGWDAACIRICTWGKFREKSSGFTFVYFNLHMDHVGVTARAESAKLILDRVRNFPEKYPVVLSGDFNVDQNNESYKLIQNSGVMRDAYTMAEFVYAPNGTFNEFYPNSYTDERIDHIFLSPEFQVKKYGILTDTYRTVPTEAERIENKGNFPAETEVSLGTARTPSDHFPVMIVVSPR